MMQSKNNPNVSIDSTYEENRLDAIESHVADSRLDEEPVDKMEYNIPFSRIVFFDNSDFHYGGQGFEAERAKLALEIERRFFNGIMVIGGDFFDNANIIGATNPYGARVAPAESMAGAKKFLEPYKGQLAFMLGGNHDSVWGNRNKVTNIGPEEELARSLNVPYARYSLAMTLNLLEPDTAKVKKMVVCSKHEVKDPSRFIAYLIRKGIIPDVIIREHTHDGNDGIYTTKVPVYDKNGLLNGYENHQVFVLTGKSMQNGNTYYGAENLFDLKTNAKGILLFWKQNPFYDSNDVKQPKYIPVAVPFNVLHENELRPSAVCERLLSFYQIPNIERYMANRSKGNLSEVAASLDHMIETTRKKFGNSVEHLNAKNATMEDENVK